MQLVDAEDRVVERLASEPALLWQSAMLLIVRRAIRRQPCEYGVHFAERFHDAHTFASDVDLIANGLGAAHAPPIYAI
jgi:hypothetical protein